VAGRRPIIHDQFLQLQALERLSVDSQLERRPTVIFELDHHATGVVLLFEGKEVRFPAKAAAAVDAIAESDGSFSAAELPGRLDKPGRLVLVRRLVREGFLHVLG
jgi:hypothetical protein